MNTTALITGASSGIGCELAKIHAEKSGNLVLVARREDKLMTLKQQLETSYKVDVEIISMDLSIIWAGKLLYDEVKQRNIQIDYLINNAWFWGRGYFHERNWEEDKQMIQLNIMTLTELTRLFLDDMVSRNSWKILNVSSTASFMPGPLQAVYFASKSYVQFFSNALSQELAHTNITVTNLMPGATETEFAQVSGMDKTWLFEKTVSAYSVAMDWYTAMMKGDIDIVSGLTTGQKIMMWMIPFTPKKIMLQQIFNMQKINIDS